MATITNLTKKAHALWRQGHEKDMIPILKEAILQAEHSKNYAKIIELKNDLGGCYRNIGNFKESIKILQEALSLYNTHMPSIPSLKATLLLNLANSYREKKEYFEADENFSTAKKIFEELKDTSYAYISLLNNYALLYQELGKYSTAEKLQKKAVSLLEKEPTLAIPLAISYNNLYEIQKKTKSYTPVQILEMIKKAEKILLSSVGSQHPIYAAILNTKADFAIHNREYLKALKYYKEACTIVKTAYGNKSEPYKTISENIQKLTDIIETLNKENISLLSKNQKPHTKNNISKTDLIFPDPKIPTIHTPIGPGLKNAQAFAEKVKSELAIHFPQIYSQACLALVGVGSECLGYDDAQSRDHDYKTRCQLFLPRESVNIYKTALHKYFQNTSQGELIICDISEFYKYYTFFEEGPKSIAEFRKVPTDCLRTATNGMVFYDAHGLFTQIRQRLLNYYPESLRRKRIVYCLNKLAQSGQYNYPRILQRGDYVGSELACTEFITYFIRLIHLLNYRYMPFYKWAAKSAYELPLLGKYASQTLSALVETPIVARGPLIEEICKKIREVLSQQKLSTSTIDFLTYQAESVRQTIENSTLRQEDPWTE